MTALNLAVRFVLELCALAALGYWGWQIGDMAVVSLVLAVALPLVAAVAWGTCVSPKRKVDVARLRWVVELTVFACATVGLLVTDHVLLAATLAAAYVVNRLMLAAWGQDTGEQL